MLLTHRQRTTNFAVTRHPSPVTRHPSPVTRQFVPYLTFFFQASPEPGQLACERLSSAAFLMVEDQSREGAGAAFFFEAFAGAAFLDFAAGADLVFFAVGIVLSLCDERKRSSKLAAM
jgi:hypothetical protein